MKNYENLNSIVCTSKIIGKPIVGEENELLGVIEDIVLGQHEGEVRYIIMSQSKLVGEKLYGLPWSLLSYDVKRNAFKLKLSHEALLKMPTFDRNSYPEYVPHGYTESQSKNGLNLAPKQRIHKDSPSKAEQEKFIAEGGDSQPFGVTSRK